MKMVVSATYNNMMDLEKILFTKSSFYGERNYDLVHVLYKEMTNG